MAPGESGEPPLNSSRWELLLHLLDRFLRAARLLPCCAGAPTSSASRRRSLASFTAAQPHGKLHPARTTPCATRRGGAGWRSSLRDTCTVRKKAGERKNADGRSRSGAAARRRPRVLPLPHGGGGSSLIPHVAQTWQGSGKRWARRGGWEANTVEVPFVQGVGRRWSISTSLPIILSR